MPYIETKCVGPQGSEFYQLGPSFDLIYTLDISKFRKFYHRIMSDINILLDRNVYLKSIGHSGALCDVNNYVQRQLLRG